MTPPIAHQVEARASRSRPRRVVWIAGVAALGLAGTGGPGFEPAAIVELLNESRHARGLPALRWVEPVGEAARVEAEFLADQARSFPSRRPELLALLPYETGDLSRRLADAGYEAAEATATLLVGEAAPAELLEKLLSPGESFHDEFLYNDLTDLGLGLARLDEVIFVVAILARSEGERFTVAVGELGDLGEVRQRLLEETNAARRSRRRPPLRADRCLGETAQRYAERMLAEGFFGHLTPEGEDVEDRVRGARCALRIVGENLAVGPLAPAEAVVSWIESRPHRRNLLDPAFTSVGFGLAYGRNRHGYQVLWVQLLGR